MKEDHAEDGGGLSPFVDLSSMGTRDLPTVPAKVYKEIMRGKYVDFDSLLSHLEGGRTKKGYEISLQPQEGDTTPLLQYSQRVDSPCKVTDLPTWLRAWTVYLEIFSHYHTHLVHSLIRYQGIITRFSARFHDQAWVRYDILFRQKVALHTSVAWEREDDRLFHEILVGQEKGKVKPGLGVKSPSDLVCFKCQAVGHTSRFCNKKVVSSYCYKFNSTGCVDSVCKFQHVCRICGGGHPVFRCTNRGKH